MIETDFVNQHDRWYPLRTQLSPTTVAGVQLAWTSLCTEWKTVLDRVDALGADAAVRSVNGEWCVRDTLRHLVFAMEKWFVGPVLGEKRFSAIGLPNTGSQGGDWLGLDLSCVPAYREAVAIWEGRREQFGEYVSTLDASALPEVVTVLENGEVPTMVCFHVVLEEVFEHLRYTLRDLELVS